MNLIILCVNRSTEVLNLAMTTDLGEEKFSILAWKKKLRLKIEFVSHPARLEVLGIYISFLIHNIYHTTCENTSDILSSLDKQCWCHSFGG